MTTTTTRAEVAAQNLGERLVASAEGTRDRAAAQALADEGTLLALPRFRDLLVTKVKSVPVCRWEGVMGRQYTLGLEEEQRAFLGLLLSLLGIGITPLSAVEVLDERRLRIIAQAILNAAGSDSIAIGTRM